MTAAASVAPASREAAAARLRRSRWPTVTVAVLLGAAGAACGWQIYLSLRDHIGTGALGYGVLFAFVPVIPLAAIFVWLNRVRPEPRRLLVVALCWGMLAAAYFSLELNSWLAQKVGDVGGGGTRSAVFVAPWVEETMKGSIVFFLVWWRRLRFHAVTAGVVYGGLVGVGFAFTENIVYYSQLYQQVQNYQGSKDVALSAVENLFWWRGVAAPFVHPMFTMMTGLGIGLALHYRHVGVRVLAPVAGFCAAVLLHMGYNAAVSFVSGNDLAAVYGVILLPTLGVLVGIVVALRQREWRHAADRLDDYTAYGWLPPSYVDVIARPRGRRQVRRYVRRYGKAERDRVRRLQRVGMELSWLREQVVRGTAGESERARERELVAEVRAFRGTVMLPEELQTVVPRVSRERSSW